MIIGFEFEQTSRRPKATTKVMGCRILPFFRFVERFAREIVHNRCQSRIALAPRRLLIVHRLSLRVQLPASFDRVVPMLPCHVSRINVRADGTVNDVVAQHGIVSSAVNHDRSARTIIHIPIHGIAAVAVIEIDAHRVHMAGIAAPILIYPMHPRSFAGFVSNDVEEKRIRNSLIRKDQFGSK